MPRVSSRKEDREARIGRIGRFCPRQSEIAGPQGREKMVGPQTNHSMPLVTRENVQKFKGQ
ncbi:hypothetical protein KI387_004742, partial [Taxus chinensis]